MAASSSADVSARKLLHVNVVCGRDLFKEDENSNYVRLSLYDKNGNLVKKEGDGGFQTGEVSCV